MSGKLTIIPVGGPISVETFDGEEPGLERMQELVGGYIEVVYPRAPMPFDYTVVNEEGLLLQLPLNHLATGLAGAQYVGTVLLVSNDA